MAVALRSVLRRQHLVRRLEAAQVAVLEAGGGYGKSTLAAELAASLGHSAVFAELPADAADAPGVVAALRRALRRGGLAGVAEALADEAAGAAADAGDAFAAALRELLEDREDPVVFIVDEVQRATGTGVTALAGIARAVPAPHRVVLLGRRIPAAELVAVATEVLRAPDLAFSTSEVAALGHASARAIDEGTAGVIAAATGGWPAAVGLALGAGVTEPAALRRGLDGMLDRLLPPGSPERRAAALLAQLPLLSPAIAEVVAGSGALERVVDAGLPVRVRPDGWTVVPDPVRDVLARGSALDAPQATSVARAYLDAGEPQVAASLLLRLGLHAALAALLAERRWQELRAFELTELRTLLSLLPDPVVAEHPKLLLGLARVAESAAEVQWRGTLLDRAQASAVARREPELWRELEAERAADASYHGDVASAIALGRKVLEGSASQELTARARALGAMGRARAFERTPRAMVEAADLLSQSAALLDLLPEPEWRGQTLLRLGYSVHFAEGDLDAARQRVREAVDAAPLAARERANVLTFLADVLLYAGELDEAEAVLREVAVTGRRLRDQRLLGYHAWMRAAIASRRGDAAAVATWLADAERHPGDWFDHPTGIEFLADAVDHLGRVGEHEEAARYLARAEGRCASDPHEGVEQIALTARAVHGARAGDPLAAERDLVALLDAEQLPRRETWRVHLLRALAALRRGDEAAANRLAARAFQEATALGHPELPTLHEPAATAALLAIGDRGPAAAAVQVATAEPRLRVRVLGGFTVTAGGRPVEPPPGRPTLLVKLLAVEQRPIALDEVVEVLWPETDPEVGRARLRNVISRIKSTCGELIRRDGEALVLAPDVVVDAAEFETEVQAALQATDVQVALARRALALYGGELLPADRYEEFAVVRRERLAMQHLALLDALARDAEERQDVDEALRLYDQAIAAAPLDEHRYEEAAALALEHGRRRRARGYVEQALRVLEELGAEPSPRLRMLARRS